MSTMKLFYRFYRQDLFASLSLFLISLPIAVGIAVASHAPPESGIISAIFGAIFYGIFSTSHVTLVGPAAGLCVFLAAAAQSIGAFSNVSSATVLAGTFLIILSKFKSHKIIDYAPQSVMRAMVCGIGLTLILKTVPYLIGYETEGRFSYIALGISAVCLTLAWISSTWENENGKHRRVPYAFLIILLGAGIAAVVARFFPALALTESQMLHLNPAQWELRASEFRPDQWLPTLKLSLMIMAVILLEGTVNRNVIQKFDPQRRPINHQHEMLLLGIGNVFMGLIGALPVMPILIRSTANLEFGSKTRLSAILQGIWLIAALVFSAMFQFIPMAAVAAVLVVVGFELIKFNEIREMFKRAKYDQIVPFAVTLVVILSVDLLWGILTGLAIGVFNSFKSAQHRSMVLVQDDEHYLLKFFKDVTFVHKSELKETLENIPEGKKVVIDGTGNIVVDSEIEDWLLEYQEEAAVQKKTVLFRTSSLAISKLFKVKAA
ncbi:MAG: SulP family inorganic anion transporter [Bdellovibrionales bacterium]|nr:SulP family inorganic anion transporter [Bdellovibrionales bacterium]